MFAAGLFIKSEFQQRITLCLDELARNRLKVEQFSIIFRLIFNNSLVVLNLYYGFAISGVAFVE